MVLTATPMLFCVPEAFRNTFASWFSFGTNVTFHVKFISVPFLLSPQ